MINKKSLWFLTLFSLILVLSVYYITMPSELLLTSDTIDKATSTTSKETEDTSETTIEQIDTLTAMRVESDSKMNEELESLQVVLNDENKSADEKNEAYEKMQQINNNRAEEEALEKQIKKDLELSSYIKIDGNSIKVVVNSSEHDTTLANKIMRTVQSNYETSKYITVQFQK